MRGDTTAGLATPIEQQGAAGAAGAVLAVTAALDVTTAAVCDPAPTSMARALRQGRLRTWTGILGAYFSSQSVTQLLGILAGLLFIRTMPVPEFALYTLASSVLTFFAFMTDLGSTTSLLHFYNHTRIHGAEFKPYMLAVLSLRRWAFFAGAVVVCALLPTMALAKGFAPWDATLTTAAVLVAVGFQIVSTVRILVLRLEDRYAQSYRAEMSGAALRLTLAGAMVLAALLHSWVGVLASAGGSALSAWLARDRTANVDRSTRLAIDLRPYRRAIFRYLLPTLPGALYFAVQGPLVVWLAATFGAARNIAEVGALGRLGLIVGIFSGLTGVVFLPRLAHITNERLFRLRTAQFGAVHLMIAAGMLAVAMLAPDLLLWVLGRHYAGLHTELELVVAAAGLSLLDGYLVAVNLARSWTRWQTVGVGITIGAQAILIAVLPLQTVQGVLTFNCLSSAVTALFQGTVLAVGFLRPLLVTTQVVELAQ